MMDVPLSGESILVIENNALIAYDLRQALEGAGARVIAVDGPGASAAVVEGATAAVVETEPDATQRRRIVRLLREQGVPFLFYGTERPTTTTSGQGAPFVAKPAASETLVAAVALLVAKAARP